MKPYPRANISEGDGVTLSADLYNRMVEDIERLDRLAVMPPLSMISGASGSTISVSPKPKEFALVAIIGTETGGGRYQGSILSGNSTGSTSTNFQLQPSMTQSATDGPAFQPTSSGAGYVNNALVVNLMEPYVGGSHLLAPQASPLFCAVGRVMGTTAESTPRTIVYISGWPISPVIAKITGLYPTTYGGVYYGRIVQGQFCNGSNFGYDFPMSDLGSSALPTVETCWITNQWEQTYGTANHNALSVGTYVWGMVTGFPIYSVEGGVAFNDTIYQVFTWFPPQSATLAHPIQSINAVQTAGSSYSTNEQTMLNNLKTDVTNLYNSLSDLYGNLKAAGYSL